MKIIKNYVTIDKNNVDEALAWAKENCPSYITNDGYIDNEYNARYYFIFGDERDMISFSLRWS